MSEIMTDIDPVRDLGLKGDPGEEELAGDTKSEELVREWLKEIEAAAESGRRPAGPGHPRHGPRCR